MGLDAHGVIVVRKWLYRAQVLAFIAQLPPTLIGMKACGGAHDWARRLDVLQKPPVCIVSKNFQTNHQLDVDLWTEFPYMI